jgi:hypothetical protein
MKLLLENWREYLNEVEKEEELKQDLLHFIQNNNLDKKDIKQILAGEEVLNETIGQDLADLYKKYGKRAISGALVGMIGLGTIGAHHPGAYAAPDFSGPQITQMQQADTNAEVNAVFLDKVNAALNKAFTSLKEKVPVDVRMGAKYLAGGESEVTSKDFTQAELDFLADMVTQKTEGGQKSDIVLGYDDWDKSAKEQGSSSALYDLPQNTADACQIKMDKGEAAPGYCYGQAKPDSIVSSDTAVQMKRVFGMVKVTEVGDGKYELTDVYDFNKGQSAGVMDELIELVKDLTDSRNDQKSYTAMRRLFQMRGASGYKGYPIKVVVDIGVPSV